MNIGLFLDVDITLTVGLIQEKFAELLGIHDEYIIIEEAFQSNSISSDEFGRKIVELFSKNDFSQKFVKDNFDNIVLNSWIEEILDLPVTVYLVSSAPSYYIYRLAKKYSIPKERILCSEYTFNINDRLVKCKAVSAQVKKDFVHKHKQKHLFSIGIGDSPTHDGPFVSECDLSILTKQHSGYLYAESLENVYTTIKSINDTIEKNALLSAERKLRKSESEQKISVSPHWKGRNYKLNNQLCFLLMPFSEEWSKDVWILIEDIAKKSGYECKRADEQNGRIIMNDLWKGLNKANVLMKLVWRTF
ncbi:MAG: hypothetical protein OMM_01296 [Candidatus Magnetoglobus multicellularis str. Araruama]|uniref:Phosphoserine phosphatase n=1 Tax=Candidatus Magnetoglobus multicellularis str. Araruama TaxID=890399 RepID=A0A1V1PDU4_9BACT|nr:MAG: hypothetical protein OMM_01296 [Candidatus Magnetoglobus multicellularis str. Araruama]